MGFNSVFKGLKLFLFSGEKSGNTDLQLEVALLRDALEAERTHSANLSISLDQERGEKDAMLK